MEQNNPETDSCQKVEFYSGSEDFIMKTKLNIYSNAGNLRKQITTS